MEKIIDAGNGYTIHLNFRQNKGVDIEAHFPPGNGYMQVWYGRWLSDLYWPVSKVPKGIVKALEIIEKAKIEAQAFREDVEAATETAKMMVEIHKEIEG